MTSDPPSSRSRSFGQAAGAYRRSRPPYPASAVRWLVPDGARRVLDLAAGTGKLTGPLLALGVEVVAVEPDDGMRAELAQVAPAAKAMAGSAEEIPAADGSFDAVVVGQAWHWFDAPAAAAEIARVLAPTGQLGIAWNVRDYEVPWVEEFTQIIHRGDSLEPLNQKPVLGDLFRVIEQATFAWLHRIPVGDLRTLATSRSHTLTLPPVERERLLDEVDTLVATHSDLAGRDEIEMPYRTACWRARLRP